MSALQEKKTATITVRGKTTTIKYITLNNGDVIYARVTWESGEETFFYKGMYGKPKRWEAKGIPDDLIEVLSEIFEKETPVISWVIDQHRRPD